MKEISNVDQERFLAKVDIRGQHDCWLWQFGKNPKGYGRFKSNGETFLAHRIAFAVSYGQPYDMVLHSCPNRACVNPLHLFHGDIQDKTSNMIAKGNLPTGEKNGCCKLPEQQVLEIAADPRTQTTIAAQYGVSQSLVSKIKKGRWWSHLTQLREN